MEGTPESLPIPSVFSVHLQKPMEKELDPNVHDSSANKAGKSKPSKFKSIFTKSSRKDLPQDISSRLPSGQASGIEAGDKGDIGGVIFPRGVDKDFKSKSVDAELQDKVQHASLTKGGTAVSTEFASQRTSGDGNKSKSAERSVQHKSRTRTNSRSADRKKDLATIHDNQRFLHANGSSRRTISGTGEVRQNQSKNLDPRKRGIMKQKNRELLLLVEELTHNCEYYRNALKYKQTKQENDKYQVLKENESLSLELCKLGEEIEQWKEKCMKMENKSLALTKAKNLTKENRLLLEDIDVLKSVICRLNKELAYYQERLRVKFKKAPEHIPTYSTSSGTDIEKIEPVQDSKNWLQFPKTSLLPLLTAYDEVIAEKEEIIRDHEHAMDRFKARSLELTRENEDLHKLISESKERGSISIEEWEFLRSNAALVLEENDLLHEQIDNLKRKEEVMFTSFQDKTSRSKFLVGQLEAEIGRLKSQLVNLENKCKQLTEENVNMSTSLQTRIPKERHDAVVQEFKHIFEGLKSTYETNRAELSDKVTTTERERDRLVAEVTHLETENTRLCKDLENCENSLAANVTSLQQMKAAISEASSAKDATNSVIEDFMKHVQTLVSEKNKLIDDLSEQKLVNEQMMALRSRENELVAELHRKIEAMGHLHNEEIRTLQNHSKELDLANRAQDETHKNETSQLYELLKEKDRRIATLETEKKQLEQDLETVWRTTTTTMQTNLKSRRP